MLINSVIKTTGHRLIVVILHHVINYALVDFMPV